MHASKLLCLSCFLFHRERGSLCLLPSLNGSNELSKNSSSSCFRIVNSAASSIGGLSAGSAWINSCIAAVEGAEGALSSGSLAPSRSRGVKCPIGGFCPFQKLFSSRIFLMTLQLATRGFNPINSSPGSRRFAMKQIGWTLAILFPSRFEGTLQNFSPVVYCHLLLKFFNFFCQTFHCSLKVFCSDAN